MSTSVIAPCYTAETSAVFPQPDEVSSTLTSTLSGIDALSDIAVVALLNQELPSRIAALERALQDKAVVERERKQADLTCLRKLQQQLILRCVEKPLPFVGAY